MKQLLELHILQNFAPSNLNRDDTGSPKDAYFGGFRRGRISSQCLKRAMREYVRTTNGKLLPDEALALRTKRVSQDLVRTLKTKGRDEGEAAQKVTIALGGVGLKVEDDGKTQYLLFLGRSEIERLAALIDEHWDTLTLPEEYEKKKGKAAKKAAKAAVPSEIAGALRAVLDGGKAVDVALFGRMLADLSEKNRDAACQVAHALSTNAIEREFDYYTAVDDLKPEGTAGADMIGTVEFTSACFYRYAALDLAKLVENLQGDKELALKGIEAFLRASVKAKPSGKQNTFAAHNDPEYLVFTVRQDADPRNLANAFEKPVRPSRDKSLTEMALERLEAKWKRLEAAYGQGGGAFTLNLTEASSTVGEGVESLDELIAKTMQEVRRALEG
jgi:CRISPR system Cascade subunit CasC